MAAPTLLAVIIGALVTIPAPAQDPATTRPSRFQGKDCLASGCHAPLAEPKFLHGPLVVNECRHCHEETDVENHKYRTTDEAPALCFACHAKLQAMLQDSSTRPHRHPPVDEGQCLECHDPHASGLPMQLREDSVTELCLGCHEDDLPLDAGVHSPIEEAETGCIACHRGHHSQHQSLLRQPGGDLCLRCHQETSGAIATLPHVHSPVGDKECGACHTPHASPHGNLLVESFAADLYVPFDDGEHYGLCFQCHDIELVEETETDAYTDFRNGEQNLHALHVNKAQKGRSCRACHSPHATNQPRLIRSKLPFGDWELTISYRPTATGGYCGPACHPAKRYDRSAPIDFSQEPAAPERDPD
jgi:predicted CXXCH cytochrome family protein